MTTDNKLPEEKTVKPNCYKCIHRRDLIGDCHSSCVSKTAHVKGNPVGLRGGWFSWPYNFDPVWLLECDSYESNH